MKFIPLSSQHPAGMATSVLLLWLYYNDATLLPVFVALYRKYNKKFVSYYTYDATQQIQAIMLRHCSTTTARGPMLPWRQDVAMMLKQEERQINSQPFNGMNFILLQLKEQVVLLILQLGKQHNINCLS